MPKDPNGIRSPSFRAKLNQIKGLSPEEHSLFNRIGNLVDTLTYSQRQTANPRGRRRKVTVDVPRPENVVVNTIIGGIQVGWDPVDIPELDFYEVQLSESTSFAEPESFTVVGTSFSFKGDVPSGTLFVRIRTITKRGFASQFTTTISATSVGSSPFSTDQDQIDPENRTTVLPKPLLAGAALEAVSGAKAFVGVGMHVGPSPATMNDNHTGFSGNIQIKNEIAYDLHDPDDPFPSIEQRLAGIPDEFIDVDPFYNYSDSFYMRFITLTGSVSDFFSVADLETDPATLDVQFLRYRILNNFYFPDFNQVGYVWNASMGIIKF